MKSFRIHGLNRLLGIAVPIICTGVLFAQVRQAPLPPGETPAALCSTLREGYTNFAQCHSATQAEMCAMAQLAREDQTQAHRFDAIMGESDPDKAIRLVDEFAGKYPTSSLLSYAYFFAASAYQQKGNIEQIAEYAGKSLKLDPDNLMSLILSVEVLPQPQYIKKHPTDRANILRQAQSEADHALRLIPQILKLSQESDGDYQKRQAAVASEVHGALGTVHMELASGGPGVLDKAELAKAEQEFQIAVSTTRSPDPRDYYRLGEAYGAEGKWDEAIQAFTKAGKLGQDTAIKAYASEQIAQLKKRKAQGLAASNRGAGSGH